MSDVTQILSRIEAGDPNASEKLLPLVYDELKQLAAHRLAQERPGHTLQPTALVHEAYLRLIGADERPQWNSRGHFFAAAAEAMRRILIEHARRKSRLKHGGGFMRVDVDVAELPTHMQAEELIDLDEALEKLRRNDPLKAQLVTLRYFGGLTIDQASEALNISRVTAFRYWTFARAWLHHEMTGERPPPPPQMA